MQVCNAILDLSNPMSDVGSQFPDGILLMPIIVFDGHLYSYENGELSKEEGIYYFVPYSDSSFMIQIVTEPFLETYLAILDEQIEKFQTNFPNE
jgi:hypothetical protein